MPRKTKSKSAPAAEAPLAAPRVDAPPTEAGNIPAWLRLGWAIAAAVATLLYIQTLGFDFTYDDDQVVRTNLRIRDLSDVRAYLWTSYWDAPGMNREYRPLTLMSYAAQYAVAGLRPWSYHAVNVALNAMVAAAAWLLAMELFARRGLALFVALLFAIHPVHVEAVAGVVGRAELGSSLAFVLGLFAAIRSIRAADARGRWRWAAACGALSAAAILTKENTVTIVGAIALLPFFALGRGGGEREVPAKFAREAAPKVFPALACATAMVAVYMLLRLAVLGGFKGKPGEVVFPFDNPLVSLHPLPRTLSALKILGRYAWLLVFPFNPSPDYSPNAIKLVTRFNDPSWILGGMIVPAYAAALWALRRRPASVFGLLLFLVTFIITSNLFLTIGTVMGERLLYLPSLGFCFLAGDLSLAVFDRRHDSPRWRTGANALAAALALFSFAFVAQTLRYLPVWKSNEALYSYMIGRMPESARVNLNYGEQLVGQGKTREALQYLERADQIVPDIPTTLGYLGHAYFKLGRIDDAQRVLERAVRLFSGDIASVRALARVYASRGRMEDADRLFAGAFESGPPKADLIYDYGWFLADWGGKTKDHAKIRRGLEFMEKVVPPGGEGASEEALIALGRARMELGEPGVAEPWLRRAVESKPDASTAIYWLARALLAQGRAEEARPLAERLAKLEPNSKSAQQLLADVAAGGK